MSINLNILFSEHMETKLLLNNCEIYIHLTLETLFTRNI